MARQARSMDELREQLIQGRGLHELSRKQVAAYLGLTERTIERTEKGGYPSSRTYLVISALLDLWDIEYKRVMRSEENTMCIPLINAKREGRLNALDFPGVPGELVSMGTGQPTFC